MVWPTKSDNKLKNFEDIQLPGQMLKSCYANSKMQHAFKMNMSAVLGCVRLTGIMATMGKCSNNVETIERMLEAGMNIAILNLTFGSREEHVDMIAKLREASTNYSARMGRTYPLSIAIRLSGRKIRTGYIADIYGDEVEIKADEIVRITTDETYKERCSLHTVYVDFPLLGTKVEKGDYIMLDNQLISMKVEMVSSTTITCKVERGGMLGSNKDVFIPHRDIGMPYFSDKDKRDIKMAIANQVDIIIVSYVYSCDIISALRKQLGRRGRKMTIMSCIQTLEGYKNFQEILVVSNAIMISRQELATDLNPHKMVIAQKTMIAQANVANVPVCVTDHVLSSMRNRNVPLRAEILDISNCIFDGTDILALSAETAVGVDPVRTIATLSDICKQAELCAWTLNEFRNMMDKTPLPCDETISMALGAAQASQRIFATAIIVTTSSGKAAQLVSKYKPRCPIIAVTRYISVAHQLQLYRGIVPLIYKGDPNEDWEEDLENRQLFALTWAIERGFAMVGKAVILMYGHKHGSGFTNTLRVNYVHPSVLEMMNQNPVEEPNTE